MNTNTKDILNELKALGDDRTKAHYTKSGAHSNMFGVKLGDIRKLAKKLKANHDLAMELWATENIDARLLAILLMKIKLISSDDLDKLVCSMKFVRVADWMNAYIVNKHPDKETLRKKWMQADNPMAARSGWNLTSIRIAKNPDGLDLDALLNRIEAEMGTAVPEVQWTMNFALVELGINFARYREQALNIGEQLGIYRDYPTAKGCTSPYAPIWINEMVSRQKK